MQKKKENCGNSSSRLLRLSIFKKLLKLLKSQTFRQSQGKVEMVLGLLVGAVLQFKLKVAEVLLHKGK